MKYETKDSGERVEFASGMVRDTTDGKPRYDLIPHEPLKRLAELYARGAEKYGDNNWQLANSEEELNRFKASAARHFHQWLNGEQDEDHGIATAWNIFAYEHIKEKVEPHNSFDREGFISASETIRAAYAGTIKSAYDGERL